MASKSQLWVLGILLASACAAERGEAEQEKSVKADAKLTVKGPALLAAKGGSFSCVPGCALKNDEGGRPIVPDWCLAWSPITPVCVRNGDKVYCAGRWAGAGRTVRKPDATATDFQLENAEEIAKSPYKPLTEVNFVCTRIDANATNRFIETSPDAEGLLGEKRALVCAPGCLVGKGLVSEESKVEKPDWCYRLASEYVYGRRNPNEPELALCNHIRPKALKAE